MSYQIIIFLTKTKLFACEINNNGEAEAISIKGNTGIKCEGKDSIDELITCIFDRFNIDDFADENFDVVIIESDADREIIKFLETRCAGTHKLNIISIEKLLPIIASNKNLIKVGEEVIVKFADQLFKISCNESNIVEIGKTSECDIPIILNENDFTCLYRFAANTTAVINKNKLEETRYEINRLRQIINSYETELKEQNIIRKQIEDFAKAQRKDELNVKQRQEIFLKALKLKAVQDYNKAFELFKIAAEMGSIEAYSELGWCYLSGYGVEKNKGKATEMFLTAGKMRNDS